MSPESDRREEALARENFRRAIMSMFCLVMQNTTLPPMAALRQAAAALGLAYREAASTHLGEDACRCGWLPSRGEDVEALKAALAATARQTSAVDLRALDVAGSA
jgi:hypothetical protein